MKVKVKRVYDKYAAADGVRVLADRLWPRGVRKEEAHIDIWIKDLAPSDSLRKWFHQDTDARFAEFSKKYRAELMEKKKIARELIDTKRTYTLITAVKDVERSHIPTLTWFLEQL